MTTRELTVRVTDPANQVHRRLHAGDVLIVHGHRVLHGRTGFSCNGAHRHPQDACVELDDLLARLDRLLGDP